jgi:hypothetical protein
MVHASKPPDGQLFNQNSKFKIGLQIHFVPHVVLKSVQAGDLFKSPVSSLEIQQYIYFQNPPPTPWVGNIQPLETPSFTLHSTPAPPS